MTRLALVAAVATCAVLAVRVRRLDNECNDLATDILRNLAGRVYLEPVELSDCDWTKQVASIPVSSDLAGEWGVQP